MGFLHFSLLFLLFSLGIDAATFTLRNRCNRPIWPGILAGGGHPLLMNGGLELQPQQSIDVIAPHGWSGRFWARDGCRFDASGKGTCVTGDCGRGLQCSGAGGIPPASLAEFTLDSPQDFYDVSLVDGYNIPISIVPTGGQGNCSPVMCTADVNLNCPDGLQVRGPDGRVVACKSACMAFNRPEFCCTAQFNDPKICKPSQYSVIFKRACPTAYSYPYDDATSTFVCQGANYLIAFC